jgi:starch phosphorylase
MNEGHSAFLAIERIYQAIQSQGLIFDEARVIVSAGSVFTTHTTVSAGSDYFPPDLVDRYFGHYYSKLGISRWEFLALGRQNPYNEGEEFCTTVLAFRLGTLRFGVSRLHGKVSRRIWHGCWPHLSEEEVPIAHVTNGIHPATWTSFDFADLFDHYLGPRWREAPQDPKVWSGISHIPDEELWGLHERHRERLISFTRNRLRQQRLAAGATASDVGKAGEVLRPDALTIGFARRFATYKRAYLIFSEPERLARLLNDPSHPMQIIITGKAHPRDDAGKALIRDIVHLSQRPEFARSVVFLEDYDMTISRYLFQGADVWLNNPRRPFEASGTSGMKAAINGVLNVSILDGWWDEAYRPEIGWAIGHGEEMADEKQQDRLEAAALYHLLESEVKPLFYQRGDDNLPRQWIIRMKAAMRLLGPYYNTNRMVLDYLSQGYTPAAKRVSLLSNKNTELARRIAAWRHQIWENWSKVRVERVSCSLDGTIQVGQSFTVEALISLDPLSPSDVSVQVVEGPLDSKGNIAVANAIPMLWDGRSQNPYHFAVEVPTSATGQHGFTVRVMPHHPNDPDPYATGVLTWADDAAFS